MRRAIATVLLVVSAGACDSPTAPSFPDASGTFVVDLSFIDLTTSQANGFGTITFTQASREAGDLGGALDLTVVVLGQRVLISELRDAWVDQNGLVAFRVIVPNPESRWTFSGRLAESAITGTHLLEDVNGDSFQGRWTAARR